MMFHPSNSEDPQIHLKINNVISFEADWFRFLLSGGLSTFAGVLSPGNGRIRSVFLEVPPAISRAASNTVLLIVVSSEDIIVTWCASFFLLKSLSDTICPKNRPVLRMKRR